MRTGVVDHAAYGDRMEPALTTRSGYPSAVPCWIDTERTDPKAAADFYGDLFGWEFENQMPSDAPGRYLMARLHGHDVAAIGATPDVPAEPVWNTYLAVDDADATAATVVDAGGRVLAEPFDGPRRRSLGHRRRSVRRRLPPVAGRAAHGRGNGQRPGHLELERPQHAKTRSGRRSSTAASSGGRPIRWTSAARR
jgi:predicted enzyme related to lactoylglutathione lyase